MAGRTYPPGMTLRIWCRALLAAVAAAALVAAGQLGVAYGLGIVRLGRSFEAGAGNQWNSQLAWVSWFAMLAAVAGTVTANRSIRRRGLTPGVGTRIILAICGGIGAGTTVPLTIQPARSAHLAQTVDPALVVGIATGLGAVAGILISVAVLSLRPLAWSLATVAAAAWLTGLVGIVPYLGPNDPLPSVRLGVPQWTTVAAHTNQLTDTLAMPVLAWLIGAAVAAAARARRESGLGIAVNGVAGAAPLALAYLIAGPGPDADLADQMSPYLGALIAVPAGLLGSLLVGLIPHGNRDSAEAGEPGKPAEAVEPADILPPLTPASPTAPSPLTPASPLATTSPVATASPTAPSSQQGGSTQEFPRPTVPTQRRSSSSGKKGKPAPAAKPSGGGKSSGRGKAPGEGRPAPRDEHVDWVSALSTPDEPGEPAPHGRDKGGKASRRGPGGDFPAGT